MRGGYGVVCVLPIGRELKAHRVAWVLHNGVPIPPESPVVRHSCDNPSCVNPAHLMTGTQTDNVNDAVERGRNSAGKGERHHLAKLTEDDIREIRKLKGEGATCRALGRQFGVGGDQISRICTLKVWQEVL